MERCRCPPNFPTDQYEVDIRVYYKIMVPDTSKNTSNGFVSYYKIILFIMINGMTPLAQAGVIYPFCYDQRQNRSESRGKFVDAGSEVENQTLKGYQSFYILIRW